MALILVVDDDDAMRGLMNTALERAGHEVVSFDDAAPAILWSELHTADVVVTDLIMSTPGEGLINSLQRRGRPTPVIVVSGYVTEEDWRTLGRGGTNCFIEKPFDLAELVTAVDLCAGA